MSRKKKSAGSQLKSVSHQLAHYVLPYYLKNHEDRLLDAFVMLENDPEIFLKYMRFLVFMHCEATDKELENTAAAFEMTEEGIDEGVVFVILKMPEAKKFLEAEFLLFVFIAQDNEAYVRYFTYELGKGIDKQQVYFVCEWAKNGDHLNYNCLEDSSMESFANMVKEILFKNLSWNAAFLPSAEEEN